MKKMVLIGLGIMSLVVIVGIVRAGIAARTNNDDSTLVIGHVLFPGYAPLHIAQEKGYFGDTNVSFVTIDSLGDMRAALAAGKIDGYLMTYDMFQSVKGTAPEAIAVLATDDSHGADGIVASSSIQNASDLRGALVGSEPGFPAYFLLLSYLHDAGMKLSDVTFKDIPTKDVGVAFRSGAIQVAGAYEPFLSEMKNSVEGAHVLVSTKDTKGLMMEYLWVSPEVLSTKQHELQKVAKGYFAALEYIATNPQDAFAIGADSFGITTDEMSSYADAIIWPDVAYNNELLGNKSIVAQRMFDRVGDVLRSNDETDLRLDADTYFTSEIIDSL